jgi:hypothetical protein
MQEALLRVRDVRDHLKVPANLPPLPLSMIRGTAEAIRDQRASEFNAFLEAVQAVPQLRRLPPYLQLLAPDDLGANEYVLLIHLCYINSACCFSFSQKQVLARRLDRSQAFVVQRALQFRSFVATRPSPLSLRTALLSWLGSRCG